METFQITPFTFNEHQNEIMVLKKSRTFYYETSSNCESGTCILIPGNQILLCMDYLGSNIVYLLKKNIFQKVYSFPGHYIAHRGYEILIKLREGKLIVIDFQYGPYPTVVYKHAINYKEWHSLNTVMLKNQLIAHAMDSILYLFNDKHEVRKYTQFPDITVLASHPYKNIVIGVCEQGGIVYWDGYREPKLIDINLNSFPLSISIWNESIFFAASGDRVCKIDLNLKTVCEFWNGPQFNPVLDIHAINGNSLEISTLDTLINHYLYSICADLRPIGLYLLLSQLRKANGIGQFPLDLIKLIFHCLSI